MVTWVFLVLKVCVVFQLPRKGYVVCGEPKGIEGKDANPSFVPGFMAQITCSILNHTF